MLDQKEKTFVLTPFVVAYSEESKPDAEKSAPRARKPGTHLSKDEATREVLQRIAQRVKKI
ncbi:MAG: hypothetical protein KIS85_07200 [Anaerolineales bacterium]|nr:hypothetical protein [Anaerolineales bacterium]